MILRSLLLALTALAVAVPAAGATTLGDQIVPIHDASDGVTIAIGKAKVPFMRFAPKAAKLYKQVAGKRTIVACGRGTDQPIAGTPFSTSGYGSSTVTLPRKRSRVFLLDSSGDADVCTLSTRERAKDDCLPNSASDAKYCARVIVPVTDAGRRHLDALARSVDLLLAQLFVGISGADKPVLPQVQETLGHDVVELATPDASPPAGKVGFWLQGENLVVAVLLQDGTRRFVSHQGGVMSTNDPAFMGPREEAFGIFT